MDNESMEQAYDETITEARSRGQEALHRGQEYGERAMEQGRHAVHHGHRYTEEGAAWVPSEVLLMAAGASVLGSLALKFSGRNHDALFVGQWAPTLVGLAVFTRLVQEFGAGD